MDETSIKVKGQRGSLYRAVEKTGQTIDVLLTGQRERSAALRFLTKAIRRHGVPDRIAIDGSEASAAVIRGTTRYMERRSRFGRCALSIITRPMLGFKSFEAAKRMLVGIELMHMLRKGRWEDGVEQGQTSAEQFYALAA
jgi:putative transposase